MRLFVKPNKVFHIHDTPLPELEFDYIVQTNNTILIEQVKAQYATSYSFFNLTVSGIFVLSSSYFGFAL